MFCGPFGTEKNKDILIHFLNDILGFTGSAAIHNVEFLSTIQDPEIAAKKQSIVDVLCKDSEGSRYIIQLQSTKTKGFEKRAQYYAAKAYSSQADQGDKYNNIKEIIFIAIADCIIFPNEVDYKSKHIIQDEKTNEHDLKHFYFMFIELPKFTKTKQDQLKNIVEKWCFFFRYAAETKKEDLDEIVGSDVIIKRAYDEMNRYNWSEDEFHFYEHAQKCLLDKIAALAEKFDEGVKVGRHEGEQHVKVTVAKNMLKCGMAIDFIANTTGLPQDEIVQLKKEIA